MNRQELTAQEEQKEEAIYAGGVQTALDQAGAQADQQEEKDFEDYELGLMTMDFSYRKSGRKVQVLFSLCIVQIHAFSMIKGNRKTIIYVD